jgi:hypothetical protein
MLSLQSPVAVECRAAGVIEQREVAELAKLSPSADVRFARFSNVFAGTAGSAESTWCGQGVSRP